MHCIFCLFDDKAELTCLHNMLLLKLFGNALKQMYFLLWAAVQHSSALVFCRCLVPAIQLRLPQYFLFCEKVTTSTQSPGQTDLVSDSLEKSRIVLECLGKYRRVLESIGKFWKVLNSDNIFSISDQMETTP